MGNCFSVLYKAHKSDIMTKHTIHIDKISTLCTRWKKLRAPETMTPNEFKKAIIQSDEIPLDFSKYYESGSEIEVIEYLASLIILSDGKLDDRLRSLFQLFSFEDIATMQPEEFLYCCEKTMKSLCLIGEIQMPPVEGEQLEDFKRAICRDGQLDFYKFKSSILAECAKFAEIFQESHLYVRTISTIIIENPFPVISYLQKGSLFLGKYEILAAPELKTDFSSIYKKKYKHAMLNVKPMLGGEEFLTFELIYVTGMQGDKNFRQNYFREIVLKNRLMGDKVQEFGELPGGLLYKMVTAKEMSQTNLEDYFQLNNCRLTELQAISLGLKLLDQLQTLHSLDVIHSNINPSSVYLLEPNNFDNLAFLDLEVAIWDPAQLLNTENAYFQQLPEDKYDTSFRDEDYLSPEHKELAEEYKRSGKIPKVNVTKQCDLYSIGAILFKGLTGRPPRHFSESVYNEPLYNALREPLAEWESPPELQDLTISNGMASFLIKVLSKNLSRRHKDIEELREDLLQLETNLLQVPSILMESLQHAMPRDESIFRDDYILDLTQSEISDFTLEYLLKFVQNSQIPRLKLFGGVLPLRALKMNKINALDLEKKGLYSEDLRVLSLFLSLNSSLISIKLAGNPLLRRQKDNKQNKIASIGFKHFVSALRAHSNLSEVWLGSIEIGPGFARDLCSALSRNRSIRILDLEECGLLSVGVREVCELAKGLNSLVYLNLSANGMKNEGARAVAELLAVNHAIQEMHLSENEIGNEGGEAIVRALRENFVVSTLKIERNQFDSFVADVIGQNVTFNTQYVKFKNNHERLGEFGYNLIAENIKRWVDSHRHVTDKLRARLSKQEDETDIKLAEILLDSNHNLNLRPIPQKYTYNPGDGTIFFEYK